MENNNYYQQAQYQQPVYQAQPVYQQAQPAIDPEYDKISNEFLTMAIVSGAISSLPIGSFIALAMAIKNRKKILEYIDNGGIHTGKIKTSSALSRAAKYSAVICSVWWIFYGTIMLLYFILAMIGVAWALTSGNF